MIKKLLTLASAALLSLSVHAAKFTGRRLLQGIDRPESTTPMVTEFFSFYCPHCNSFEPMMQALKKLYLKTQPSKKSTSLSWAAQWVKY